MAGVRRAAELLRRAVVVHRQSAAAGRPLHGTCASLHTQRAGAPFRPRDRSLQTPMRRTVLGVKHVHSDSGLGVPELTDAQARQALNALLATNWSKIEPEVRAEVEAAIAKGVADAGVLATVWSSARAAEKFAETLVALRMELDELSGGTGESVGRLPETLAEALESAFRKYTTYLGEIGADEDFLNKKVENDLGSILVQIKQRCGGLDPKWGKITLLGTSGLSGSYIELRATTPGSLR